ncbi:MAG: MauE/DoxX family redox-associated membrane protein [Cytophagaceae bacterium]
MKWFLRVLSSLTGLVFIVSAVSKLYPIEFFELSFVESNLANWTLAPFYSRLLIGLEFFAGLLLLININPKRLVYSSVIGLLVLFSGFLVIQIILQGNTGNCGCFGEWFKMTPLHGILKNVFLIGVLLVLHYFHSGFQLPYQKILIPGFLIATFSLPFILNPVNLSKSLHNGEDVIGYKLDLDILYNHEVNLPPKAELRKGKWVLAYLSLTCSHCKIAAYKLQVMQKKNPELPIYFILNGKKEGLAQFYEETKSDKVPFSMFIGANEFIKMSGPSLPAIYLIEDQVVKGKANLYFLDQGLIEDWLREE